MFASSFATGRLCFLCEKGRRGGRDVTHMASFVIRRRDVVNRLLLSATSPSATWPLVLV
jgi:hypothetical protein